MKSLHTALLAAQKDFPLVKKTEKNPFFKSSYAGLPNVLEVAMPILHAHGLYITQAPCTEGDRIGVTTTLTYAETGESLSSSFTVALAKNDPQGAGSAITYARRYALVSMLGLNVDDDDDGNAASTPVAKKVSTPAPNVFTTTQTKDELGF